ncbi:MAG: VanW family protein [Candidatus Daviesbacteria bacterium]|nr:MAG: VanW family protein [Candidatus Daviesbacteria bacterium]
MFNSLVSTILSATLLSSTLLNGLSSEKILASRQISLEKRYYPVQKENILLNLAYMNDRVTKKEDINWDEIKKPFWFDFRLEPGQTFAFHNDVLPKYQGKIARTTKAHFNWNEGFKSYGYLVGDGVCHLASLMYWVAKDAGLEAVAPTNHNFMPIPEISREYGVSIYNNPLAKGSNVQQNLYITNNKEKTVIFKFEYDGDKLKATVLESN